MAQGDVTRLQVYGSTVADDSGGTPNINGFVAAFRCEGMIRRGSLDVPVTNPLTDVSSLEIHILRPGYDETGTAIQVPDVIRGGVPHINTYPPTWASLPAGVGAIPPDSWCCNGAENFNIYHTAAGGTKGASPPTHTIGAGDPGTPGTTVTDGGVLWTAYTSGTIAGRMERIVGGDVDVFSSLDFPVYGPDILVSGQIDSGAYVASGVTSTSAPAIPSLVNSSTLVYPKILLAHVSPPHDTSRGLIRFEMEASHAFADVDPLALFRVRAVHTATGTEGPWLNITRQTLSEHVPLTSPGGGATMVYGGLVDTTSLPIGDCHFRYQGFPHVGNEIYDSEIHAEGAPRLDSTLYDVPKMVRRVGANYYFLHTAGTTGIGTGPTGTATLTDYADGTAVWRYFGNSATATNSSNPQSRYHFFNDVASARSQGFACVNPTGANIGVPQVWPSQAAALAAKGTASYGSALLAATQIRAFHNNPANGIAHDDLSGGEMIALAGNHIGLGTASLNGIPMGTQWIRWIADPTEAPGVVQMGQGAAQVNRSLPRRTWVEGFTASNTGTLFDPATDDFGALAQPVTETWVNRMTRAGTGAATQFVSRTGISWHRNGTYTAGLLLQTANRAQVADIRGCSVSGASTLKPRHMSGNRLTGDVIVRDPASTWTPTRQSHMMQGDFVTGGPTRNGITIVELCVGNAGEVNPLGFSAINLMTESYSSGQEACFRVGADLSRSDMRDVYIFGCGAAGNRRNYAYDDVDQTPLRENWFDRGNCFETSNTASSYFAHGASFKGVGRYQNLWAVYNVGARDNVSWEGSGSGAATFKQDSSAQMRRGVNCIGGTAPLDSDQMLVYVDNRSRDGIGTGANTGGGNYAPSPTSGARNRVVKPFCRFDRNGRQRNLAGFGAAGAFEELVQIVGPTPGLQSGELYPFEVALAPIVTQVITLPFLNSARLFEFRIWYNRTVGRLFPFEIVPSNVPGWVIRPPLLISGSKRVIPFTWNRRSRHCDRFPTRILTRRPSRKRFVIFRRNCMITSSIRRERFGNRRI